MYILCSIKHLLKMYSSIHILMFGNKFYPRTPGHIYVYFINPLCQLHESVCYVMSCNVLKNAGKN